MGKTLFVLDIPDPKRRKIQAPPVQKHKNKKLYSRKIKHKARAGEAFGLPEAFFICSQATANIKQYLR